MTVRQGSQATASGDDKYDVKQGMAFQKQFLEGGKVRIKRCFKNTLARVRNKQGGSS